MRRIVVLAGAFVMWACALQAQSRSGPGEPGAQFLSYEAVTLPADGDPAMVKVNVHYRIDREFFVPVKTPDLSDPTPFRRRGEVLFELIDSAGTAAARALDRIEIGENDAGRRPEGHEWQQGVLSFSVRPGSYTMQVSVDDLESKRNYTDNRRIIDAREGATPGLASASVMLIVPASVDSSLPGTFSPMNYGGEVLFGRPSKMAVIWTPSPGEDSVMAATITFAEVPPSGEGQQFLPQPSTLLSRVHRRVSLRPASDGNTITYTTSDTGAACVAIFPFPSESLLLRSFSVAIVLSCGAGKREISRTVRTVWPDMPFSLKDIDYALDALKYITTEEQLDSLRRGNLEVRRRNLESFWRNKDRTRGTAFNEVETEYYRRVDHAVRTFGTLRLPDGFRSDRGRIYILYGAPARTERALDPSAGFQETWVYEHPGRKFVFVDQTKSGNYLLMTNTP